jgi:hypothetical protein
MTLQDQHPYDATILGLQNLYMVDSNDNLYINSPCILSADKTIIKNHTYILVESLPGNNSKVYPVMFIDGYFKEYVVYLFVQDLITQCIFIIDIEIESTENKWVLVDINCLDKLLEYKIIKSSCGKC